jgi:hypothetical protein
MSYKLIKALTVSSNSSFIEFDNIPQNYNNLLLYSAGDTDRTNYIDGAYFVFNKDTAAGTYSTLRMYSNGGVSAPGGDTTRAQLFLAGDSGVDSQINSNNRSLIFDYTSNYYKNCITMATAERDNAEQYLGLNCVKWSDTSAISNIRIYPEVGTVIKSGSNFYLYGIGSGSGGATVS